MPTSAEIHKQLIECGLLNPGVPLCAVDSVDEYLRVLVADGHLTPFQARAAFQGRAVQLCLGRYVLLDQIGSGGMGTVFKAVQRETSRTVALKVLSPQMACDAKAVERFRREAAAAVTLAHPRIVTAFEAAEDRGVPFLAMEYIDGCDLSSLVKQRGPLPWSAAVDLIRQLADIMSFAHGKGVIHRDLKPGNLLVTRAGEVKLLDLGLARLQASGPNVAGKDLTQTGSVMGTADYMSPEQALDSKQADCRSDIYSLGCTLFFLLTGEPPYEGDTVMKKLLAHRESPIPLLSGESAARDWPAGLAQELDQIVTQLLAKRPADRFATMKQVEEALAAVLTRYPVEGPQQRILSSLAAGVLPDRGPHPGSLGHSALSGAVAAGNAGRARRRRNRWVNTLLAAAVVVAIAAASVAVHHFRAPSGFDMARSSISNPSTNNADRGNNHDDSATIIDRTHESAAGSAAKHPVAVQRNTKPADTPKDDSTPAVAVSGTRIQKLTDDSTDDIPLPTKTEKDVPGGHPETGVAGESSKTDDDNNSSAVGVLDESSPPVGDDAEAMESGAAPSTPGIPFAEELQLANYVRGQLRGAVRVSTSEAWVTDRTPLPSGEWRVVGVHIRELAGFTRNDVVKLSQMSGLRELHIRSTFLRNEHVAELCTRLPDLQSVAFIGTHLDDSVWDFIARLPQLQQLTISSPMIRGRGFDRFRTATHLTAVGIHDSPVGDVVPQTLSKIPGLVSIQLGRTQVSAAGIEALRTLPELRWLWLSADQCTVDMAAAVVKLPHLRRVAFVGPGRPERMIGALKRLAGLRPELPIEIADNDALSDSNLFELDGLGIADEVHLVRCRGVTLAGLEQFQLDQAPQTRFIYATRELPTVLKTLEPREPRSE